MPFPELGEILDDPALLQDFMNVAFGDAPQAEIDAYLARERELLRRWAEADPQRECRQDRCLVTLGRDGRPVMVVERATNPGASPYRRYDHAAQRARFQEHYTLNLEVEGSVRLLINGVEPFIYGTVTDRAESSTFVNDWLLVGTNVFELVPLSKKARVRFAVGGHAPFIPSPDTQRANRIGFDGVLGKRGLTFTLDAPPAPGPTEVSWPEDLEAHLDQGLALWIAGADEYAWLPWSSWPDDGVREALRKAGTARLTLAMVDIELPVGHTHFLTGQFVPDPAGARWVYAELTNRPFGDGATSTEGAFAPFAAHAAELLADLRADGCPAVERKVAADDWIASLGANAMADRLREGSSSATEALRQACLLAATHAEVPVSYRYDDVVFAMRDADDRVLGTVYGEFSFRYGPPLFSLRKEPRLAK